MHNEITDSLISYLFSFISVEVIIIVLFHKVVWIKWGHKYNTGLPCRSNGKQSACNAGDLGLIPGLGRSSGKGNGRALQYSFLENPMDRGAWGGYSLLGHKQLDKTEGLTLSQTFTYHFVSNWILSETRPRTWASLSPETRCVLVKDWVLVPF